MKSDNTKSKKLFGKSEPKSDKPVYILCPRCELNYIDKTEKYCDICKAELGLIDASVLIPEETEEVRVCPVCHVSILEDGEDVCFDCLKEAEEKEAAAAPVETVVDENAWALPDDEPEDEAEELALAGMEIEADEFFDGDEEEEEEEVHDDDLDFPVGPDDYDIDIDEEEDDEEDDGDFF